MFDWRWLRNDTPTAGPCCREPGENGAPRCGLKRPAAALAVLACSDDRRDTAPGSPATIADRLRANADAFAYTIGRPGAPLTVATISDPLTLNLAIATGSASVDVLETDYRLIDFGDLVGRLTATYEWEAVIIGFSGGP